MNTDNRYLHPSDWLPLSSLGKWSLGLHVFFLLGVGVSLLLVNGLDLLSYDDRWWDMTVPILGVVSITAFIVGLRAIRKYKDSSVLVRMSVGLGIFVILFALLHSLFIND